MAKLASKKQHKTELVPEIVKAVADKGAAELIIESTEVMLDMALVEGVLKDLPLIGTIVNLGKVGLTIKDHLFLKKLSRFLTELNTTHEDERLKFGRRVAEDPVFGNMVGEKILLLLDRLDDMQKPALIGKAFAAYLQGRIDCDQFNRMAIGIDRAIMQDLIRIQTMQSTNTNIDEKWGPDLVASGLASLAVLALFGGTNTSYYLNNTGSLIREICFNNPSS